MIRNLKALGLALVAVFAMSALAAAGAQAEKSAHFEAESYPATVDAIGEGTQDFTVPGLPKLTCTEVSGNATLEASSNELIGENIAYETCHVVTLGITFPVTVDTNNCTFTFTAHTFDKDDTNGDGAATGDVHIGGCDNGSVTITVFKAGSSGHPEADIRCTIHVPNQTPGHATEVTYLNETTEGDKMAVTVDVHLDTVETTVTSSTICGTHRTVQSTYDGSFWAKATSGGNFIDGTVAGTG